MLSLCMLEIQVVEPSQGTIVIRLSGKLVMGPESAALESMVNGRLDAGFATQAFEVRPVSVVGEQVVVADIDVSQGH